MEEKEGRAIEKEKKKWYEDRLMERSVFPTQCFIFYYFFLSIVKDAHRLLI